MLIIVILLASSLLYAEHKRKKLIISQDQDDIQYCLERELVICPRCRTSFVVSDIEEQFSLDWECEVCGCRFTEKRTHTIIRR